MKLHYSKQVIVFGLVAIMALIGYLIWSGYREAINLAESTSRNYAVMIEARVDATFRRAEAHIAELVRDIPEAALNRDAVPHYASVIDKGLDLRRLNFPELVGLRVWGANGDLMYTSESKTTKRVNIKERDYYRVWQEGKQDGVFYSSAVVSIITGRPAMFIAQALRNKQGELLGLVTASVELEYFQNMFGSLDIGKSGSIAVYRSDNFSSVVQWPTVKDELGFELPRGTPTREAVAAGKQAASLTFASVTDGIERIYSLRVLNRYPFFVVSGIGRDDALEGWRMRSIAVSAIGLLLLLLLGSLLLSLLRAEKRMKQLNADLSATMKAIPDLLFEVGLNGQIYDYRGPRVEFLAEPASVFLGKNFSEVLPPDAAETCISAIGEASDKGWSVGKQYSLSLPQGKRWFELSVALKSDTENQAKRFIVLARDTTERKRAENQLEESLSLLNATLDATEDAILVVDLSGKWVLFNRQFVELWQIPNGIAAAKEDSAALSYVLIQLEDPDGFLNKVRELYAAPEANSFDSFNFKDGKTIERYSAPHRIGGAIVGRVWSFRDITRRIVAERQMRRLNADLTATLKAIPDLLFELDDDGKYINIWASNSDLLATQKESLLGHTVTEMLPVDAANTVMSALREAEKEGCSSGQQIRLPLPHGHCWFELSTSVKTETETEADRPVKSYIMLSRDITERKQMQDQVHQLAFYEHLTKLPNRLLLNDRLSQVMAASKRSRCYGALMFLDLDNFKPLNDAHGHVVGDMLLIEVAARLKICVREVDTVSRFGGDEFVVLINELMEDRAESEVQARRVAEKIRSSLAKIYLLTLKYEGDVDTTVEHHCTASIGVALFIRDEASQDDILKWADIAMYQAKEAGRNSIRLHNSTA